MTDKYKYLSDTFGLKTKAERMAVRGYRRVEIPKQLPEPRPAPTGFQNKRKLKEHFRDHGAEFGCSAPDEYSQKAIQFFLTDSPNIEEVRIPSGRKGVTDDHYRFNHTTLEFGIMRSDGKLRTYHHLRNIDQWNRKKI